MDYKKFTKCSAVYKIICTVNNKIYIGSAKNLRHRINRHQNDLQNNKHCSPPLQASYNKYGNLFFVAKILTECKAKDLIKQEQYYIDAYNPEFNTCLIAGSPEQRKLSKVHKANISNGLKGRSLSDVTKKRIGEAHRGKKMSVDAIEKIRKSKTGLKQSEENIAKRARVYGFVGPDGTKYIGTNLKRFCEEHNLHRSNMKMVLNGKRKTHHGFTKLLTN